MNVVKNLWAFGVGVWAFGVNLGGFIRICFIFIYLREISFGNFVFWVFCNFLFDC